MSSYQKVLNSAILITHSSRHLFALEGFSRILVKLIHIYSIHIHLFIYVFIHLYVLDADQSNQENDERHSHHGKHPDQQNPIDA